MAYQFESAAGFAGDTADMSARVTDSYAAEGAIDFGAALQLGTDPDKQVSPFLGGTFAGVAKFAHNETGDYADKETVSVVSFGRVMVDTLAVAVVAGEIAYVVDATGVWTNVITAATAVGTFKTSGTGIVTVDLKG